MLRALPAGSAQPTSSTARAASSDGSASQAALGHRTSGRRKAVPGVFPSDTSVLPGKGEGPGTVWDGYPDHSYLSGRRSSRALRSRQSIVAGTARSPALGGQDRPLFQKLAPAVGRRGNPTQSGSGEGSCTQSG